MAHGLCFSKRNVTGERQECPEDSWRVATTCKASSASWRTWRCGFNVASHGQHCPPISKEKFSPQIRTQSSPRTAPGRKPKRQRSIEAHQGRDQTPFRMWHKPPKEITQAKPKGARNKQEANDTTAMGEKKWPLDGAEKVCANYPSQAAGYRTPPRQTQKGGRGTDGEAQSTARLCLFSATLLPALAGSVLRFGGRQGPFLPPPRVLWSFL